MKHQPCGSYWQPVVAERKILQHGSYHSTEPVNTQLAKFVDVCEVAKRYFTKELTGKLICDLKTVATYIYLIRNAFTQVYWLYGAAWLFVASSDMRET